MYGAVANLPGHPWRVSDLDFLLRRAHLTNHCGCGQAPPSGLVEKDADGSSWWGPTRSPSEPGPPRPAETWRVGPRSPTQRAGCSAYVFSRWRLVLGRWASFRPRRMQSEPPHQPQRRAHVPSAPAGPLDMTHRPHLAPRCLRAAPPRPRRDWPGRGRPAFSGGWPSVAQNPALGGRPWPLSPPTRATQLMTMDDTPSRRRRQPHTERALAVQGGFGQRRPTRRAPAGPTSGRRFTGSGWALVGCGETAVV